MPSSRSLETFLPNFCAIQGVFVVVVSAELLAFVLTLFSTHDLMNRLDRLAMTSLFVQWDALTCAGLLCLLRCLASGRSHRQVAVASLGVILLVTWALSEGAWWLLHSAAQGNPATPFSHGQFVLRNVTIAVLVGGLTLHYCYVQFLFKQRVESESQARIQALQSRIRPHFLFNSMNTIASLTRSRPADAERAVEDLADLFRASLSDARERVTLGEELDLANQYLRIEQLRLGDRLEVDWDVADLPAGATVPALVVQPLLENAIYHGIERRPTGGLVRVHGARRDSQVQIVIENPLADAGGAAARDGNQLAQENVRQRLEAHFGKQGRLEVHKQGDRYQAILTFPYQIERAL